MRSWPDRTAAIRRAVVRLCAAHGWVALHEVGLPNNRRADLLALTGDGGFVCIEIKSGLRDFLTDAKWPEYRSFSDALYFAVDADFPPNVLPEAAGLIVAHDGIADILRPAPMHPLSAPRRRVLTRQFAQLAAARLMAQEDPQGMATLRTALRPE